MAPFQAAVPGSGQVDTPGPRDEDLWVSSRPGRAAGGQRVADRRAAEQWAAEQRAAEQAEAERRAAEQRAAEQRAAEQVEAERRAAEQREAERRAAQQRAAERRAAELSEMERREAERLQAQRREAERRAAEARAVALRAAAAPPSEILPSVAPASDGRSVAPRVEDDRSASWSTGPAGSRPVPPGSARTAGAVPPAGGPAYGDWTRPSRAGDDTGSGVRAAEPEEDYSSQRFARLRAGAPTEATELPEREIARRMAGGRRDARPAEHDVDDEPAGRARGPVTGPGPVTDPGSVTATIGGRAALRAERQAAEAARKKAARDKRSDGPRDGGSGRRSPRRAVFGLVAVAIVALGVLGVYSFASPHTQQAASQTPTTPTASGALGTVPGVSDLPPLSTAPPPTSAAPATPVRVPVTVLNSTNITGLAASIAGAIKSGGWQTLPVGEYKNTDVATTTVYFTQGDEQQRQAALQLIQQYPQLHGPAARFFDVPAAAAGGLVIVATGDWKP